MAYEWLRKSSFEADRNQEAALLTYLTNTYSTLPSFNILQRLSNALLFQVFKQHRAYDRNSLDIIATRFRKELDQKRIDQVNHQLTHANGQSEN